MPTVSEAQRPDLLQPKVKDPRLMGALWVITRFFDGAEKLFLVKDTSKYENAAGQPWVFTPADEKRWGLMGGGRQINHEGKKESWGQNLLRELEEELGDALKTSGKDLSEEARSAMAIWLLDQYKANTLYPFLVGQLVTEVKNGTTAVVAINEIAASVKEIPWDLFPVEIQKELDRAVAASVAEWMCLSELSELFNQVQKSGGTQKVKKSGLEFRPQALTAAQLFSLNQVQNLEIVKSQIQHWNRQVKGQLRWQASRYRVPINNGVIGRWGTPKNDLPQDDLIFLQVKE